MSTPAGEPERPEQEPPTGLPPAPPVSGQGETPPPPGSRGSLILGLVVGLVLYGGALAFVLVRARNDPYLWQLELAAVMVLLTLVALVAAAVFTALSNTRRFGLGLFISIAVGVIVDGGACVTLPSVG